MALHIETVISTSVNCKIHIVFHNLKKYGPYNIMQELGKLDFTKRIPKGSVIPNGSEKCKSFGFASNKFYW